MSDPALGTHITQKTDAELTDCEIKQLQVLMGQHRVTSYPYFSRVKFVAEQTGDPPGPYVYFLAQGSKVKAYAYSLDDLRNAAGYTNADGRATIADTNLQNKGETISGENVLIHGFAVQPVAAAMHVSDDDPGGTPARVRAIDYLFLASLMQAVSVSLGLNGSQNQFRLGNIQMIPGAGGLLGGTPILSGDQSIAGMPIAEPYASNGWPVRTNFFRLQEGLVWRNQGNADSNLQIEFEVQRDINIPSGGSVENSIAGGPGVDTVRDNLPANVASGEPGYVYPTELAIEFNVFILGKVKGPRSRSA